MRSIPSAAADRTKLCAAARGGAAAAGWPAIVDARRSSRTGRCVAAATGTAGAKTSVSTLVGRFTANTDARTEVGAETSAAAITTSSGTGRIPGSISTGETIASLAISGRSLDRGERSSAGRSAPSSAATVRASATAASSATSSSSIRRASTSGAGTLGIWSSRITSMPSMTTSSSLPPSTRSSPERLQSIDARSKAP